MSEKEPVQEKVRKQTDKIRKALVLINIHALNMPLQKKIKDQTDKILKSLVQINIYAQPPKEGEPDYDELYERTYEIYQIIIDDLEDLLDLISDEIPEETTLRLLNEGGL